MSKAEHQHSSRHSNTTPQIVAGLLLIIGLWAYWPTLVRIVGSWNSDPDYSHGYLVVPLALFFLWLRRQQRPSLELGFHPAWLGLIVVAAVLRYIAGRFYLPEIDAWSIPLWLAGVVGCLWGWPALRWAWPSLVFLWFATPLPGTVALALSNPLQRVAAQLSGIALQICGLPAIVEGTTILLGEETLEVERACSGLRMFYGITALAFASIVIMRPGWLKSIAIVLAIAPVAVLMNVLRITVTGVLNYSYPDAGIDAIVHDWSGILVLPLAMLVFLGLIVLFDRIGNSWKEDPRRTAPWLIGGVVGCIVLVLLGTWRYRAQYDQSLAILSDKAKEYEEAGDLPKAIEYLNRYTLARPDEIEQQVKLADLFSQAAQSRGEKLRAVELLKTAFQVEPTRRDLGRKALDLALETESFDAAFSLVDQLLKEPKDDATELKRKRADVLLAYLYSSAGERQLKYTWDDVAAALKESIDLPDYPVQHARALAVITRENLTKPEAAEREAYADRVMKKLLEDRGEDTEAFVARYRYGMDYGNEENGFDPAADLESALKFRENATAKARAQALTLAAGRIRATDPETAKKYLEEAVGADPTATRAYLAWAELLRVTADDPEAGLQAAVDIMQEALAANGNEPLPLVFGLAELLAEQGQKAEAQEVLEPIREHLDGINDPALRGYVKMELATVEAVITDLDGNTSVAVDQLRASLKGPDAFVATAKYPQEFSAAWRRLAGWYSKLGRGIEAADAWKQLLRVSPDSSVARVELARTALAAGDLETAKAAARERVTRNSDSGAAWVALARVLLAEQLAEAPDRRSFAAVESALKKASTLQPPPASFLSVLVDLQRAQDRQQQAIEAIQQTLEKDPASPGAWRMLASLQLETGELDDAADSIEQFAAHGGAAVAVAALRANLSVAKGDNKLALEQLESSRVNATEDDRVNLALLSAALHRQLGNNQEAEAVLAQAYEEAPKDLRVLENLAQLALISKQWDTLAKLEGALKTTEGDDGSRWKAFRGMRWLLSGEELSGQQFNQLAEYARDVQQARPRSALGPYLLAQVAVRRGNRELATKELEKAWQLGLQDAGSAQQILELLTASGDTEAVKRFASQLGDLSLSSPGVYDQVLPLLLNSSQRDAALQRAKEWADQGDAGDHIRLGRALLIDGNATDDADARQARLAEAEAAFRKALKLAPGDLQPWLTLYAFLLETQQQEKASKLLDRLQSDSQLEPLPRELALAQLSTVSGQPSKAVHRYLAACKLASDDSTDNKSKALSQAAAYFSRSSPPFAIRLAREANKANADSANTKFLLAGLLGSTGEEDKLDEAIKIVKDAPDQPPSVAQRKKRLKAQLHGARGNEEKNDVDQAIRLLEQIAQPMAADQRALAELYEKDDRLADAYDLWDRLAKMRPASISDHIRFLQFWQEHYQAEGQFSGRAKEVVVQLGRLDGGLVEQLRWQLRINADEEGVVAEDLAAELLRRYWNSPRVQQVLSNPQQAASLFAGVIGILLDEEQWAALEKLVQQPPTPAIPPALASRLLANVLVVRSERTPEEVDRAERLLDAAIQANPKDIDLLRDAADLASIVGHKDRAEGFYKKVLDVQPSNAAVSNNLVSLWMEDPDKIDAATAQLESSLQEHPDDASLHDTKGQLLFLQGNAAGALEEIDAAIQLDPAAATTYLHRCLVLSELGRSEEAEEALLTALVLGIEGQPKLPTDQRWLTEMRKRHKL